MKNRAQQATNGGIAMAAAAVLSWGVKQAGIEMPAEIVAAVSVIIGWVFARYTK